MKTWRFIGKISLGLSTCLALLALAACHPDEEEARRRPHVVEGEEAEVSLKWTMPDMEERQFQLCAPLSNERARAVRDIWVGIYNVKGECTTNVLLDLNSTDNEHGARKLPVLKTKSGESYVVAVANAKTNYGFSTRNGETGDTVLLADLLQKADSWDDYKAITAVLPKVDEVHPVGRYLVMAGSYYASNDVNSEPAAWSDAAGNPRTTVTINSGVNTLNGYIHLRRLFAYNRFTVKPGDSVKMELLTWQVVNLPVMAYLQERSAENAADVSVYFSDATGATAAYKGNYTSSVASHIFEAGDKAGEYVFDFYQFENRHTGLEGVKDYNDRDREWKDASGGNTRVYKSLCANDATPVPGPAGKGVNTNNFATYVVINAEVSYYAASSDLNAPAIAHPDRPGTLPANAVLRTGRAFYVVHLGYCEGGAEAEKARDFNVRRNHWYDYTVTVKGLTNVALEARNKIEENQPGAEGNVYDSRYVVELDAHNAVFNIKLTNRQRADLQWIIEAPYANNPSQELTWQDYVTSGETQALRKNEFYNWIRFKPAPDSLLLAIYKEPGDSDADLWTLEDLRHVADHRGIDQNGVKDDKSVTDSVTGRWYTVFVNEYVYETDPTNEATGRWKMYANQPDRKAYLNTKEEISSDGNSRYMQPQYTIVQKSIQTYYNLQEGALTTALGAEREDENYGLNMRWSSAADQNKPNAGWHKTYGWYNTAAYAEGRTWYGDGGIFAEGKPINGHTYLYAASVPAVTRQYENQPAKTYPVYRMNTLGGGYTATKDDPSATNAFYEIMAACMNRNRDENGNNKVDKEEIKWYLATTDEYLRIVLGRESLKKPLMPFGVNIADDPGKGNASRHHYAASDYQMVWSEEGVSTSGMGKNGDVGAGDNGIYAWPWQVRCLRTMGVDVSSGEEVQSAYELDGANYTIRFDYYDEASLRQAQSGTMAVHTVGDLKNRASRRLEYARENCKNMSVKSTTGAFGTTSDGTVRCYATTTRDDDTWLYWQEKERDATKAHVEDYWTASVNANEICGQYTQYTGQVDKGTWRVPNQVELTVMLRLGILSGSGNWLSCTKEYYPMNNPTRFISVSSDGVTLGGNKPFRVRCVRDVD